MGDSNLGFNLEQLTIKTRLPREKLERCLQGLINLDLIESKEGLYYSKISHLFVRTDSHSQNLVEQFVLSCNAAQDRIRNPAHSENEFFFLSHFCIKEARLAELKNELRETVLRFVDDSIQNDGDRVVHLVAALHL